MAANELTDTMGETFKLYSRPPWKIGQDWPNMTRGQRVRYGFAQGLPLLGGAGVGLGPLVGAPWAHLFKKILGMGGDGGSEGPNGKEMLFGYPTDKVEGWSEGGGKQPTSSAPGNLRDAARWGSDAYGPGRGPGFRQGGPGGGGFAGMFGRENFFGAGGGGQPKGWGESLYKF